MKRIGIALVGDFDKKMHTHLALKESIDHCKFTGLAKIILRYMEPVADFNSW